MKARKEEVFRLWDELMLLLEIIDLTTFDDEKTKQIINEIHSVLSLKKQIWEDSHQRENWTPVLQNFTFDPNSNLVKELIMKWEEIVIESYLYLQEARKRGGTLGHKIGPIWSFHKQEKAKYVEMLLQL
jgi:hypothetical protein